MSSARVQRSRQRSVRRRRTKRSSRLNESATFSERVIEPVADDVRRLSRVGNHPEYAAIHLDELLLDGREPVEEPADVSGDNAPDRTMNMVATPSSPSGVGGGVAKSEGIDRK